MNEHFKLEDINKRLKLQQDQLDKLTQSDNNVKEVVTEMIKHKDEIITMLKQPTDEIVFEDKLEELLKKFQHLAD